MSRWTKREEDQRRRAWLLARMPHDWDDGSPTRCRRCGGKFGPQAAKRACPKRRRPNRWRVHWERARRRMLYPPEGKPKDYGTAAWWLRELREVAREVRHLPELQPDHPRYDQYWRYHKLARRHRRACRELWRFPLTAGELGAGPPDTFGGQLTRARNKLIARARAEQRAVLQEGGCTYTIWPDAKDQHGRAIFTEGG